MCLRVFVECTPPNITATFALFVDLVFPLTLLFILRRTLLGGDSWRYLRRKKHPIAMGADVLVHEANNTTLNTTARPGADVFRIFRWRGFPLT